MDEEYMNKLDKDFKADCFEIEEQCEREGYPGNGSNYDLRCEAMGERYFHCYGYNPYTGEVEE